MREMRGRKKGEGEGRENEGEGEGRDNEGEGVREGGKEKKMNIKIDNSIMYCFLLFLRR